MRGFVRGCVRAWVRVFTVCLMPGSDLCSNTQFVYVHLEKFKYHWNQTNDM